MKKILLSFVGADKNIPAIVQKTKAFLIGHPDWVLTVLGKPKDLMTLSSMKNVEIIPAEGEVKTDPEKELDKAFEILADPYRKIDSFLCFAPMAKALEKAKKTLTPKGPINVVSLFPSPLTGRNYITAQPLAQESILGPDDFVTLLEASLSLAEALAIEEPTFALLKPKEGFESIYQKADTLLKDKKGYLGLKPYGDILESKANILLMDFKLLALFQEGMVAGEKLLQNYIEVQSVDSSFKFKMASYFMSGLFDAFKEYQVRNSATGMEMIVGYDKRVLVSPLALSDKDLGKILDGLAAFESQED